MAVIISDVKAGLDESRDDVIKKALRAVGLNLKDTVKTGINKVSLDARKRSGIHFVYSVYVECADGSTEDKLLKNKRCRAVPESGLFPENSVFPSPMRGGDEGDTVIAGFGPAGMFCGLVLAEYGFKPVIAERGGSIEKRLRDVENYFLGGELDTESNVQFGEGGAGTFSDGKLTTRINDPLCRYVLEKFVEFGAPEEILIKARPHIGTDNLRDIVKNIRERIISLGGTVLFDSKLTDIDAENGHVKSVSINGEKRDVSALVLAIGHSARDTFEMLKAKNIFMQPKPFSVGVRIEHKQEWVNKSLYGEHYMNPNLPVGEYQLSYRKTPDRCVYSFCMCPGGVVVPAASEENSVVTNGMSSFARDGENANAAIVVSVSEKDYGGNILDGVSFARDIERKAFKAAKGKEAPACTVRGFLNGVPDISTDVKPTYARGIVPCDLREIFPSFVTDMLREGLGKFSHKMRCFGEGNALMTAPETRTSSPVRITRTENCNSLSADNLYPCGEGAGYAGGIMSAAVDGIRTALAVMKRRNIR